MQKGVMLFFIIIGMAWQTKAQPALKDYQHLGIRTNYTSFEDHPSFYGIGPAFHVNVTNRLVLNYHLQFGGDENGKFHVHSYLGGAGSVLLALWGLAEPKDEGLKYFGAILSLLVPEGVGYSAKVTDNVYLVPYANPLGFHVASEEHFSGEFGARLRWQMGNVNIMPFLGSEVLYEPNSPVGFSGGLTISFQMN